MVVNETKKQTWEWLKPFPIERRFFQAMRAQNPTQSITGPEPIATLRLVLGLSRCSRSPVPGVSRH